MTTHPEPLTPDARAVELSCKFFDWHTDMLKGNNPPLEFGCGNLAREITALMQKAAQEEWENTHGKRD